MTPNYYYQSPYSYAGNNYMSPQIQYQPQPPQQQFAPGLKGRPVSSLEEARAAQIDFDGSLFLFPDIANKKIYTKQINLDGTAATKIYNLEDGAIPSNPSFVTKDELDLAISELQNQLALLQEISQQKEKKNESANQTSSTKQSIPF